ncbi:CTP synthetase [uncultured Litoreibacter sp.]|uniref:CTP synthetase n=1 Tax=uncultured Litoreibacter sp. TaxID=1392394 RepID=UPI00260608D1|nr:CTP synthetase [uncultured Litoreibacter sp.]
MFRLAAILFSMTSTTLAGIGVIAVLSMGYDTWVPIVAAAAVGFVLSIPATWWLAKQITAKIV